MENGSGALLSLWMLLGETWFPAHPSARDAAFLGSWPRITLTSAFVVVSSLTLTLLPPSYKDPYVILSLPE